MKYEYFSITVIIIIIIIIILLNYNVISTFTNSIELDSMIFDGRDTLNTPYFEETLQPIFV
jgi:hypothetical protein